jgi:hypothetical protein
MTVKPLLVKVDRAAFDVLLMDRTKYLLAYPVRVEHDAVMIESGG